MNVILVDDEEELASALAERLELRGVNAAYVTSGREAILKCRENHYDVAVLDMKMPGLSGVETMDALRAEHPKMQFIILSGHTEVDACTNLEGGRVCFRVKPADLDGLLATMREMTGQ